MRSVSTAAATEKLYAAAQKHYTYNKLLESCQKSLESNSRLLVSSQQNRINRFLSEVGQRSETLYRAASDEVSCCKPCLNRTAITNSNP